MGISHEYHSAHGRARRSRAGTGLRLAGVIAAILLLSLAVTAILENGSKESEQPQTATSSGMAENILAPLPMQGAAADSTAEESGETAADSGSAGSTADSGAAAVTLETFGPARQTAGGYTVKAHDSSTIRQPSCGQVDLSYFADAAFLGDSLTVGFSDYQINLGGALICGYTGVGPDAIVNRSAVKSPARGQEVALDVLAAARPKKLYILLGTNTLTTLGASDRFLAYYGQMLDMLREALGEDCVIYVQSIPPVRPSAAAEKPGLIQLEAGGFVAADGIDGIVPGFLRIEIPGDLVFCPEGQGIALPCRRDRDGELRAVQTVVLPCLRRQAALGIQCHQGSAHGVAGAFVQMIGGVLRQLPAAAGILQGVGLAVIGVLDLLQVLGGKAGKRNAALGSGAGGLLGLGVAAGHRPQQRAQQHCRCQQRQQDTLFCFHGGLLICGGAAAPPLPRQ